MTEPVALITGAGRRIGAATARHLHKSGYRVLLHYRHSITEADALAWELNSIRPDSACCLYANLNDHDDVLRLGEKAVECWNRLDLLVNNASCFYTTPLAEANEAQWDDLLASNLKAPYFLIQATASALGAARGCVVNIADVYGQRPMPNHSIYSIAKAGNIMLTQSLALELAPEVRVNGVAPGAMLWPELNGNVQETPEKLAEIPLGSLGGADAIARAVAFLAEQNSYITGHVLAVDGGRSLRQ